MEQAKETSRSKYPAKAHAANVAAYIKCRNPTISNGIIYLEGQKTRLIEDNDEPIPFRCVTGPRGQMKLISTDSIDRQRRQFFYLSGCAVPDCYLTYNTETAFLTLFIPPINPDDVIWSGLPLSPSESLELFDVDAVRYSDEISTYLAAFASNTVWAIAEQVSDHTILLNFTSKDFTCLREAIEECRVVKDHYEVALIRQANDISAIAHTSVLRSIRQASNERELEAIFLERCIAHGCREQAYRSIVASGKNAATLHYQKNDQPLRGKKNLLLDAGGEYRCYAADITRTFPISGKFDKESRDIYDLVLDMQFASIEMLKEGVRWDDVHARAHEVAIEGLLKIGILVGNKKEIFDRRISVAFFPHGLGHYLGMDTHDTGGHPNYEDRDSMFRYLRVRGHLPAGSVITVEPGIYFCRYIIEPYLNDSTQSKFIDRNVLEKYWDVGGIRIEGGP